MKITKAIAVDNILNCKAKAKEFTLQDIEYTLNKDVLTCKDEYSNKIVKFSKKELMKVIAESDNAFDVRRYIIQKQNASFQRQKRQKTKTKTYNTISDNSVFVLQSLCALTMQRKDKTVYKVKS